MLKLATIFAIVFMAELGDKTQLATLLFASDRNLHPFMVFLAAAGALVVATGMAVLLGGLAMRRPLLKPLLSSAWQLDDAGWNKLTVRFGLFFVALAGLNELVWRTQSTDFWVTYKVFGTMGLILLFTMTQVGMIGRHQVKPEGEEDGKPD